MAISVAVYNSVTRTRRNVSVDFISEVLASNAAVGTPTVEWFFKFSTTTRDTGNNVIPVKLVDAQTDLALNGTKRSSSNSAVAYATITEMVEDYLFDLVNGHTADQYSSGATEQLPMSF
jgi:hypothetical protein